MTEARQAMRIDRLLVYLRFVRTRSRASAVIGEGHIRRNGARIARGNEEVGIGDVLTIPMGNDVRIVQILALPPRRGPPGFAKSHYRDLDRRGETAIAAN